HAMAWVAGGSPKILVLKTSDAGEHGSDAAGEMRHVHGELGMTVEHAGIDQPDGRHDQRELAADAARGVVGVELLGAIELERRVHEHEQPKLFNLVPERLDRRI